VGPPLFVDGHKTLDLAFFTATWKFFPIFKVGFPFCFVAEKKVANANCWFSGSEQAQKK